MKLEEYQPLALRTVKDQGSRYMNMWHASVGMVTEFGELIDPYKKFQIYGRPLDLVNIREELGDFMWYLALYCSAGGYEFSAGDGMGDLSMTPDVPTDHRLAITLLLSLSMLYMNTMEQKIAPAGQGGPELEQAEVQECIATVIQTISDFCVLVGTTLEEVLDMNIAKLRKRYPDDAFTADAAINRDVAAERAVLDAQSGSR